MKPKHFLGLLTLAFLFSQFMAVKLAFAAECVTPTDMAAYILSGTPNATIRDLHGDAAKKILDGYNSIGTPTHFAAEEIITVTDDSHKMALIVMFDHGCVSDLPLTIRRDQFENLTGTGT